MTPIQAIAMEDEIFQLATLLFVLFGLGIEISQWFKEKHQRYWIGSILLWLFHAAFFYIFITLDRYTNIKMRPLFGSYTVWSSILRLQSVSTIVILEWYRAIENARLRNFVKRYTESGRKEIL